MAAIDALIAQIEDEKLRSRLEAEVEVLLENKEFGLVFQDHMPELVPVYSQLVRKGSTVALRGDALINTWSVRATLGDVANCVNRRTKEERQIPVKELVVVLRFGEPIFPALVPIDRVQNAQGNVPWSTLSEAENYHALQLLEYLYAGQVDCIYIDPPYNSGGQRDWKYNNNYVDTKDHWRHSKWLAMMRRRLGIAKRLLRHDGVLIIAIDENEHAHLLGLLESQFAEFKLTSVTVVHNPRGNRESNFTMVNDFGVHAIRRDVTALAKSPSENETPRKLRRWGHFSKRTERRPSFYPIYIRDNQVIGMGSMPADDFHPSARNVLMGDESIEVWPIDDDGVERRWNYSRDTIQGHLDRIVVLPRADGDLDLFVASELSQPKSVWIGPEFDAGGKYGTSLVETITQRKFPYPKSLFTVLRSIDNVVRSKPTALILDFFAGSGTTAHAVNMLNHRDGGKRRCIMVTNNEVSADEAAEFSRAGVGPGDELWEKEGVCRSITWPRAKNSILGKRGDGTALEGELPSGVFTEKPKTRIYRRISFVQPGQLSSIAKRKEFVAMLGKNRLPQSAVSEEAFVLAEGYTATVLFDDSESDKWLELITKRDDLIEFYIVSPSSTRFSEIKQRVEETLGETSELVEEYLPMGQGFPANIEYFRLDFLDKNNVALGRQFQELLPLLWLRSGSMGPRPQFRSEDEIPAMLIPEENPLAVLTDESKFPEFHKKLEQRPDVTHVFLVTDSDDAFHEMAESIAAPNVVQLYRDYLENFMINKGDRG